jgi:hypothetical protein
VTRATKASDFLLELTRGLFLGARKRYCPAAERNFVICVRNDEYPASLELRKLYVVLNDAFAAEHQMLRIIDESGEDYLYPESYFVRVELPHAVERALRKIA